MKLRNTLITGLVLCTMVTPSFTFGNSIFPASSNNTNHNDTSYIESTPQINTENIEVNQEEINNQLNAAEQLVLKKKEEEFQNYFQSLTPQERYDYLLPEYIDDLRKIYDQMKMMQQEVLKGSHYVTPDDFSNFEEHIKDYKKSLDKLNNVGNYDFQTTTEILNALDDIDFMLGELRGMNVYAGKYDPDSQEKLITHQNTYKEYEDGYIKNYKTAFEFMLMREFDIIIDDEVDRDVEDSIRIHYENAEMFEEKFKIVSSCADTYINGIPNSNLYSQTTEVKTIRPDFTTDDPFSAFSQNNISHPELTPLAYKVADQLQAYASKTTIVPSYVGAIDEEKKMKEFYQIKNETEAIVKEFKIKCESYMGTADNINKNILQYVDEAKKERANIAKANGYNSWFEYQLALKNKQQKELEEEILGTANELAIEEKARAKAEYEQRMRERIDFSKPFSQQNYDKSFYMTKCHERIFDIVGNNSALLELGIFLESDAYDQLSRIRDNGGDIVTLQQLYDQCPNEFTTILQLYKSY